MKEERKVYFGSGLLLGSLLGWMPGTIRRYRPEAHAFREGETVTGVFKEEYGTVLVPMVITRDTETKPFRALTDAEVGEAGFTSRADAYIGLQRFYPDLGLDDVMAILRPRPADPEAGAKFLDLLRRIGNTLAFAGYTAEALGLLSPSSVGRSASKNKKNR